MRKRIRPSSRSVISSEATLNETRAALTTARSDAKAPSSARNPWSRTSIVFSVASVVSSTVIVTARSLPGGCRTLEARPDVPYSRDPHRHLGLVVSLVAARLLPRRDEAGGVPALLRDAVRHRRAEHDRLP